MIYILQLLVTLVVLLGSTSAHSSVIPRKALKTGLHIDVTQHKNFHYLPLMYECGISTVVKNHTSNSSVRHKRVVGGRPLVLGRHPWMVQLYLHNISAGKSVFHCGGSYITKNVILTAAHCVSRIKSGTSLLAVMYGSVDRRDIKICENELQQNCTREKQREIQDTIIHEDYSEGNLQNDIALIILSADMELNSSTARPICLPYMEELLNGWKSTELTAVGWGMQNKFDDPGPKRLSNVLEEINIPLRKRSYCDRFHTRLYGKLTSSRFCAGGVAGTDTCSGDSGGAVSLPLQFNGEDRYFQFGIVSTGHASTCGWQGRPSIYTNVLYFMPWILDHLDFTHTNNAPVRMNPIYKMGEIDYNNELSTGLNIDERLNSKKELLPSYDHCGKWLKANGMPPEKEILMEEEPGGPRVKRIIGGRPSKGIVSFPWMAQIYVRNSVNNKLFLRCSGSVINKRNILTSASCISEIDGPFTVDSIILGNYNRNTTKECLKLGPNRTICANSVRPEIQQLIIHEQFVKFTRENDLALIRLTADITFTDFIQPICIPLSEDITENWDNYEMIVAGWGRVTPIGGADFPSSNILHSILVNLTKRSECDSVFTRLWGKLERSRVCGGGAAGIGECRGDEGSPLMKRLGKSQRMFQFGIISFSQCAQQGIPSIYTNLIYYTPWILEHL